LQHLLDARSALRVNTPMITSVARPARWDTIAAMAPEMHAKKEQKQQVQGMPIALPADLDASRVHQAQTNVPHALLENSPPQTTHVAQTVLQGNTQDNPRSTH